MPEQITINGTVQRIAVRWKTGRGVVVIDTDHGDAVRATGDIAHLSRGDKVQALGRMKYTTRWGDEFAARAIMPVTLLPALAEIEAVTDRFEPRRPARGAVLGLVIMLGKQAAAVMRANPFCPVVDPDREVSGWGYGSAAQYADLVGIPADAEVRAVAAVQHLWPRLADGSVVVSRDQLESRVATAAGIEADAARRWVDVVIKDGRLEPMGPHEVAWKADVQAERYIAAEIRRRMAA